MRSIGYSTYNPDPSQGSDVVSHSQLEAAFTKYCDKKGHTLVNVFIDNVSEIAKPGFTKMLEHMRGDSLGYLVLIHKPENLGLHIKDAVEALLALDQLGAKVVCINEDLPDPLQGLLKVFYSTDVNASRRNHIREKMKAKAILGEGLGKPPYGYKIGQTRRLEEVPHEGKVVRLMFQLYSKNKFGLRGIVRHLNQHGYLTRHGRNWSIGTIRDLLRNSVYIGTYARFGLRLPGNHIPLLEPRDFRLVQDIMEERHPIRKMSVLKPFLLSGIAYCNTCNNRMVGVTRSQRWRKKDGEWMRRTYRYYQCQSRTNQSSCEYQTWKAIDLENFVLSQLHKEIEGVRIQNPTQTATPPAQSEARIKGDISSWTDNIRRQYLKHVQSAADGTITLAKLGHLITKLIERQYAIIHKDTISPLVELEPSSWQGSSYATKKKTLETFLENVSVRKGFATIKLNPLLGSD